MSKPASDRLRQNAEIIMQLWEKRARDEVYASMHQNSLVLQNSLPKYLNQLVDELSTSIERTPPRIASDKRESTRIAKQHGHERAGYADYSMSQLIFEYHILRQVIFQVLSAVSVSALNSPALAAENNTLNQRTLNQPQRISSQVVMTLERTACFGTCPMYKLSVYGNGKVVYEGKRFVKVIGTRTKTISPTAVRKLVAEFQKIRYFQLQDNYTGGHTDAPSAITSLTMGKKQKTVHHYLPSPDAPNQLTALENRIDAVVNSRQWIGTDAERIPSRINR